ncbi:hypothetical protein LINGRAHAP2_LOCUS23807 [Linum grandiflorum]
MIWLSIPLIFLSGGQHMVYDFLFWLK